MNYERLYEYRFRNVDQRAREAVWEQIARHVHRQLGEPRRVLDPAAGRLEFINAIPSEERWAIDDVAYPESKPAPGTKLIVEDVMKVDLPPDHFDAVFVSNFLEHLPTQEAVAQFLSKMRASLRPGGNLAVLGPNFRYCADEYFDCADHTLIFTHVAIEEHLYAAGFDEIGRAHV